MRKGAAEFAVLSLLGEAERYGIEILELLSAQDGLGVSEGSIYPLLNRLLKERRISARWIESEIGGVPRKYYRLTLQGEEAYQQMADFWRNFRSGLDRIVGDGS